MDAHFLARSRPPSSGSAGPHSPVPVPPPSPHPRPARWDFADRIRAVLFDAGNTLLWLDHARMAGIATAAGVPCDTETLRRAEMRARPDLDPFLRGLAAGVARGAEGRSAAGQAAALRDLAAESAHDATTRVASVEGPAPRDLTAGPLRAAEVVRDATTPVTSGEGPAPRDLTAGPLQDATTRSLAAPRHAIQTAPRLEGRETRARYARAIVARLGADPDTGPGAAATEALLDAWGSLWVVPPSDAIPVLDGLRARGLRVGCVSNSSGNVAELLAGAGLLARLDCVVDSGIEGVEKPDPRIFRLGCDRLGADPAATVYVGDFLSLDVEGARAAGLAAVLLDPIGAWADADVPRATSLTDFASWL